MILWPGGDIPDKAKPQVVRFALNLVVDLGGVFESTWMKAPGCPGYF
jgi:hypothetical protein